MDRCNLVDEEAARLLQAAKAVDEGKAVWAIADQWTKQGVSTVQGGQRWDAGVIRRMLVSARMIGKRDCEGTLINVAYMPAILPEELWRSVRAKLLDNRPKRGRRESRELSGIALCGICGLPFGAQMDRDKPVYLCKRRLSQPGACGGVVILVEALDAKVDGEVVTFLNDQRRAQSLLDTHRLDTPEMVAIDARHAELADNKLALERAAFNPPQGVPRLPTERYWELRTEIEREQEQLQRRRLVNREAQPLREALGREWTVEQWEAQPLAWRRAVIGLVVERIEVAPVAKNERGAAKGHLGAVHNPERIKVKLAG